MNRLGLRYRQCLALAALAILAAPVRAQEAPLTQQREHTVRRGDTLWDLAGHYLGNPFLWPMIYEANRTVVENPHWIYPAERLVIPGMAAPARGVLGQPRVETPAAAYAPADTASRGAVLETVDLRRPLIPVAEYYSTPWLTAAAEQPLMGRIVGVWDPSAREDRIPTVLHPNYRVHVGELRQSQVAVGDSLVTVRLGDEVRGWGRVVQPLAILRVDSISPTTLLTTVVAQYGDAQVGDRVMALESMPAIPLGTTEPLQGGPEGSVVTFLEPQEIYGTGDHGFVSPGAGQLQLGDELAIYVPARRVDESRSEVLPPAEVARAQVVRLTDRTATIRLVRVMDTSVREGLPVRVVRRAP